MGLIRRPGVLYWHDGIPSYKQNLNKHLITLHMTNAGKIQILILFRSLINIGYIYIKNSNNILQSLASGK